MGIHKCTEAPGDKMLSGFERRLWDLTYYCLIKYGCPVMFNVFGPNAPRKMDQQITFFVPVEHEAGEAVKAFIFDELQSEIREGELKKFKVDTAFGLLNPEAKQEEGTGDWYTEEYWWGTTLTIMDYGGPEIYLENAISKPMIADAVEKFMQFLESRKPQIH